MADWTSDTIPKNIMETLVVDDLAVNYEISAGTIQAKNAATAWVNFDGTTTPPTIRDSYNVKSVIRVGTGQYDIYFEEDMDNVNYAFLARANPVNTNTYYNATYPYRYEHKINFYVAYSGSVYNPSDIDIQIFGGKN